MNKWLVFQCLSFQAVWFLLVVGQNAWILAALLLLTLHFYFSPSRRGDFRVLSIAFIGIAIDAGLALSGVFQFSQQPYWLGVLWFAFVLNFGHSLIFLRRVSGFWRGIIGAVAGSYAYLLSWQLGAVDLPLGGLMSALIIGAIWSVLLPALVLLDFRLRTVVSR